jgi:hypothetical protein
VCGPAGRSEHPAVRAAWIHVALAAVHRFGTATAESRGRRFAGDVSGGFRLPEFTSLEEWWGRHLPDYYAAFRCLGSTFDPAADVTPFLLAHVEAQLHQVRALDLRERVQQRIWVAVEEAAAAAGLAPRVANAVWDAFFGRTVSPRYYRTLADVSPVTATTDLRGAVAAGLLKSEGRARSRTYRAGDELYRKIGTALAMPVEGPGDPARAAIVGELTRRAVPERSA